MRNNVFVSGRLHKTLQESAKLSLFFFNSRNIAEWTSQVDENLRIEAEKFCLEKAIEIIRTLAPRYIVTEGFTTFNKLVFDVLKEEEVAITKTYHKEKRLLMTTSLSRIQIIGIPHPSGARGITTEHWAFISNKIKALIV